jgi:hypothetical protein
MSDKKLVRVELTYDNNEIHWLEGEDAEKWLQAANGTAVMSAVHGAPFPQLYWKTNKCQFDLDNFHIQAGRALSAAKEYFSKDNYDDVE